MKHFFRSIHLYLSLVAGLVIMFSAVTGAIMVFEEEIEHALHREWFYVEVQGKALPLSVVAANAQKAVPKSRVSAVKIYPGTDRTAEVSLMVPEKKESGAAREQGKTSGEGREVKASGAKGPVQKGKGGGKPGVIVYMDPYTGKVIKVFNRKESFFLKVEMLHRFILGGQGGIGKTIIGISAFLFFFILLTGLILWWPRTKKILFQRLRIKTDASFKRLNHDLHIVTGFYTSVFLIVIVMTGLIMAFNWINKGIFTLTGSKQESPGMPLSAYMPNQRPLSLDEAYKKIGHQMPRPEFYSFRLPADSVAAITVTVLPSGRMENQTDNYYLDQYSGKTIGKYSYSDKNIGQRIRSFVKPVHTGQAFGITGKIINFIVCLLTLSFPVTGVIMWLARIRKKEKKPKAFTTLQLKKHEISSGLEKPGSN